MSEETADDELYPVQQTLSQTGLLFVLLSQLLADWVAQVFYHSVGASV